jgi:hypothetical protein
VFSNFTSKHSSKEKISSIILFFVILFFIFGFFIRENSAGGGKIDLEHEWHNYNLLKEYFFDFLSDKYEASRFPLYHYLNILINPFIEDKKDFVNTFFLYSFLIPIFFYYAIKLSFKDFPKYKIYLILSIIFLSPFFRTSSFWGLQENLAYVFFFLAIICNEDLNIIFKKYLTLFFAFLSFYSDQKFLILPIIYFFQLFKFSNKILDNLIINWKLFSYCFLLTIPSVLIFYEWGGVTGPSGNIRSFRINNIISFIQIITIYIFPIIFFQKKILNKILKIFTLKRVLLIIILLILFFITLDISLISNSTVGGGWVYKIYLLIKKYNLFLANILYCLISIFCFFIIAFYLNILKLDFIKIVIFIYYALMSTQIDILYQEYFDPIFTLIMIFFLNKDFFKKVTFNQLIILNLYYFTFLLSSIAFYL